MSSESISSVELLSVVSSSSGSCKLVGQFCFDEIGSLRLKQSTLVSMMANNLQRDPLVIIFNCTPVLASLYFFIA